MGVNLFSLRRRAIMVLTEDGERESVYFLQLAVEHALSQDSQRMVDSALKHASREWRWREDLPKLVVLVGEEGFPQSGAPIFEWHFCNRVYCFEHELPVPLGYLGERELWGYVFCPAEDTARLRRHKSTKNANYGGKGGGADWNEHMFGFGSGFIRHHDRNSWSRGSRKRPLDGSQSDLPPRLSKILTLIRLIEGKGSDASAADLHFLGCLRDKAAQLGCQ